MIIYIFVLLIGGGNYFNLVLFIIQLLQLSINIYNLAVLKIIIIKLFFKIIQYIKHY